MSIEDICRGAAKADWSAIAAFLAAGIAGYAAWLNFKTTRESRQASVDLGVMNLREKWIWDLRQQMAEFVSLSLSITKLPKSDPLYFKQRQRFDQLYSLIPFMMDPETDKSALNALKKMMKSRESQNHYIPFSDIREQMGKVEAIVTQKSPLGDDLAKLENLFHSYLRYHWINLQNENVRPHAKNK